MADSFIKHYIDRLLRTIRSKVLLKIVKPYRRMDIRYIAKELNDISVQEVEALLSSLILDQKIQAKIDQVNHTLVMFEHDAEAKFQQAISKWCGSIERLHTLSVDRITTGI